MPTVLRFGAFRVVIYPNDHRPAHVDVIGPDHESVVALNCRAGPVTLRENCIFSRRELGAIAKMLLRNLACLCDAWRRIHGMDRSP